MCLHICFALLAIVAVPIWSKALNDIDACTNRKIYVLDLAVFAAENNVPTCDLTKVLRPLPFGFKCGTEGDVYETCVHSPPECVMCRTSW